MSKYTTQVRFICETAAGYTESQEYNNIESVISASRASIFDFDYTLFDASYKSVLETKILRHYYTREIGLETVGLWKHFLNMRLNEILPYYNQLYESALLEFNPLYDYDLYRDRDVSTSGSNENTSGSTTNVESETDNDNWNYYSDTPQGGINGLESMTYLTNATHNTNDTDASSTTTDSRTSNGEYSNTEDYLEHVYGKSAGMSYSKMLKEYRDTFLNIDMMIINDLNDLFMGVW